MRLYFGLLGDNSCINVFNLSVVGADNFQYFFNNFYAGNPFAFSLYWMRITNIA